MNCAPFDGGSWDPIWHNVAWAEAHLRTKWYPNSDPSVYPQYILAEMWGGGSPSNTMLPDQALPPYHVTSWSIQPFGHNKHGSRIIWTQVKHASLNCEIGGGCCAPFHGGAGSPSNTMWSGPMSTTTPSRILIHPTVWPQYTNVTYRQDRTGQTTVR